MFAVHPQRRVQSTRWCFTLNNWTPDDEASLRLLGASVKYLVFGREVGESGTPHLQGFILFHSNKSITAVRGLYPRAHFEVAKAASDVAANYCKKDHDFEEFGSCPVAPRGRTNRYDDFRDWVVTHGTRPTMAEVAAEFPSIFMQSGRVQSFIDLLYPHVSDIDGEYRPYQESLRLRLESESASSRKIIFVVDPVGNAGKSWFVDKFASTHDYTQILSVGRREDLSFAIDERKRVFLFDLPRSSCEFLPYTLLEQLKDRRIFSNKYESRMKQLGVTPHVAVFTNEYPDMTKLSHDRYEIIEWSNAPITDY
jgi:hypothetical protein